MTTIRLVRGHNRDYCGYVQVESREYVDYIETSRQYDFQSFQYAQSKRLKNICFRNELYQMIYSNMSRFIRMKNTTFNLGHIVSIIRKDDRNSIEFTMSQTKTKSSLFRTENEDTNVKSYHIAQTFSIDFMDHANMDQKYEDIIKKINSDKNIIDLNDSESD